MVVDAVIRHIIDIDKKADDILVKTDEYIREGEKSSKESIAGMRDKTIGKAKEEAQKLYDSIIMEAENKANSVKGSAVQVCSEIENDFLKIRDDVEDRILSRLLKEGIGGQL
jgi:uncharacterized protein YjbJ (UPF0337 family)